MIYKAAKTRYNEMKYNFCGNSGLKLPVVSLGLWHNFGKLSDFENIKEMCFAAFDSGITHFDLANNYGRPFPGSAEENFSKVIKQEMSAYRDELIISTKAGYLMWDGPYGDGGSRKSLIASINQSLKRLGIDYVDIFYHHRPDNETPIEETMLALSQIVKSGKALYVGLSNYNGEQMKKASEILSELNCPFIINQNRYSIFDRNIEENGLLDVAGTCKKGIMVFSPLAQGLLTNRYIKGIPDGSRVTQEGSFLSEKSITEDVLKRINALNKIAEARGETLAQMALNWVIKDKRVTSVLIGASSAEQIKENVKIVNCSKFSEEQLKEIDDIVKS